MTLDAKQVADYMSYWLRAVKYPPFEDVIYFSRVEDPAAWLDALPPEDLPMCNQNKTSQTPNARHATNFAGCHNTAYTCNPPAPIDWTKPIQMDDGREATYLGPIKYNTRTGHVVRITNQHGDQALIIRDETGCSSLGQVPSGFEGPSGSRVVNVPPPASVIWIVVLENKKTGTHYPVTHHSKEACESYIASLGGNLDRALAMFGHTYRDGDGLCPTS